MGKTLKKRGGGTSPPKKQKRSKVLQGSEGRFSGHLFHPDELVLVDDPAHPLYDGRIHTPVSDLESLIDSLIEDGQIHPINARKNPQTDRFEVIVGRKRVLAYREINRRLKKENPKADPILVKTIVRQGDSPLRLAMVVAAENEEVVRDTPINRARKMVGMRTLNVPDETIAKKFHCDVSTVKNLIALLDSTDVLQAAVEKDAVPVGLAYKFAKMPADEQRKKVTAVVKAHEQAKENGLSSRQTSRALKEAAGLPKPSSKRNVPLVDALGPAALPASKRLPDVAIQSALATPTLYGQTQYTNRFIRVTLEWTLGLTKYTSLLEALKDHQPRLPPTHDATSAEETL